MTGNAFDRADWIASRACWTLGMAASALWLFGCYGPALIALTIIMLIALPMLAWCLVELVVLAYRMWRGQ